MYPLLEGTNKGVWGFFPFDSNRAYDTSTSMKLNYQFRTVGPNTCGLWSMSGTWETLIKLTEIEKWGNTDAWMQHIWSAVIAHRLKAAADCFLDQQFAVTRTWDTPREAHTHKGRNEKLLLNTLIFAQWDPYARWHSVQKLEKKNWKRALF